MSVRVNIPMSNIMCMPIKLDVCMYAMYPSCQTLHLLCEHEK